MDIEIIEKIKRLPQTEETLTDVFSLLLSIEDRKSVPERCNNGCAGI